MKSRNKILSHAQIKTYVELMSEITHKSDVDIEYMSSLND
jgi:hypothetical protein